MSSIVLTLALVLTGGVLDMWFLDYVNKENKHSFTRIVAILIGAIAWGYFYFLTH